MPPPPPSPPPEGWSEAVDPSTKRKYYFNRSTGQTSWSFPQAAHPAAQSTMPATCQSELTKPAVAEGIHIEMKGCDHVVADSHFEGKFEYFQNYLLSRSDCELLISNKLKRVADCSLGIKNNRATLTFAWPGTGLSKTSCSSPPATPDLEEKETNVFKKEYNIMNFSTIDSFYLQNEEYFFHEIKTIEERERTILFDRNGQEIGFFSGWIIKKIPKPKRRRSFVRQTTVQVTKHVKHVKKKFKVKPNDVTIGIVYYLGVMMWLSMLLLLSMVGNWGLPSVLIWFIILWYWFQGAFTIVAVQDKPGQKKKRDKCVTCLLLPPLALVFGFCFFGLGESAAIVGFFFFVVGAFFIGIPVQILSCNKYKAVDVGRAFVVCIIFCVVAAIFVFSLFSGSIYMYTQPRFNEFGLFITFVVVPLVVWPVFHNSAYVFGMWRWRWSLVLLPVILFNLVLPTAIMMNRLNEGTLVFFSGNFPPCSATAVNISTDARAYYSSSEFNHSIWVFDRKIKMSTVGDLMSSKVFTCWDKKGIFLRNKTTNKVISHTGNYTEQRRSCDQDEICTYYRDYYRLYPTCQCNNRKDKLYTEMEIVTEEYKCKNKNEDSQLKLNCGPVK
jgi:hypothetical protein